jgi:hypothetical protein
VHRDAETTGTVYVYAPPGDNMLTTTANYVLVSPGLGAGTFTMIGADGQRGGGHDNAASNELSFFDGAQIAGPPIAASDWDGSAGWPLPQLWDTHTHNVRIGNAVSKVRYQAGADCLVPVGFDASHLFEPEPEPEPEPDLLGLVCTRPEARAAGLGLVCGRCDAS